MPSSDLKRFLKHCLWLALPFAVVALGLEAGLRRVPDTLKLKQAVAAQRAGQAELLVLGASDALRGLSPDLLGVPGLNLANVGQDRYYDTALFRRYAPGMPHLKVVLISMAYGGAEYQLPNSPEYWRCFLYARQMGIEPESPAQRHDTRRYSALAFYEPQPALKEALRGFRGEPSLMQPDGWEARPVLPEAYRDEHDLMARKQLAYLHSFLKPRLFTTGSRELQALVKEVRGRGLKVVLLTLPVSEPYARLANSKRVARMRWLGRDLARDPGVRYWDYFRDPAFEEGDFMDPNHLNRRGAEKLTGLMKGRLKRFMGEGKTRRF
jgi:hypothetical protein